MIIIPKRAETKNFSRYGDIVKLPAHIPTSQDKTYKFWSDIAHYHIDGETEIGLCTVFTQSKNIIDSMERHLGTPEILIPVDGPFYLPLVKDGESEENAEAFRVDIGEAVVVDPGVWHGACVPVEMDQCTYFVIFKRGTSVHDVQKKSIKPLEIVAR